MKERVLVIFLMLSLILNVYFVFFNTSPIGEQLEGLTRPAANLSGYNITNDPNSTTGFSATLITPTPEIRVATTPPTTKPTAEPTPTPTPSPTPDPNQWKTYSNSKYKFSLTYPPGWELIEKASGSTAVVINTPTMQDCNPFSGECFVHIASFSVEVDTTPEPAVLEDYFNKAVAKLQQQYSITSTSKSAPTMLAGNKAYEIDYYTKDSRGNRDKSYVQYYSMIDDKVYILTYTGTFSTNEDSVYETNKPDAQKIIDSFEVERVYKVV